MLEARTLLPRERVCMDFSLEAMVCGCVGVVLRCSLLLLLC